MSELSRRKIEYEARRELLAEMQNESEAAGRIPGPPALHARKYRNVLKIAGLSLLGVFIAEVSVMLVYVVWNLFLHINLNP